MRIGQKAKMKTGIVRNIGRRQRKITPGNGRILKTIRKKKKKMLYVLYMLYVIYQSPRRYWVLLYIQPHMGNTHALDWLPFFGW